MQRGRKLHTQNERSSVLRGKIMIKYVLDCFFGCTFGCYGGYIKDGRLICKRCGIEII